MHFDGDSVSVKIKADSSRKMRQGSNGPKVSAPDGLSNRGASSSRSLTPTGHVMWPEFAATAHP
jgi:hypothetical protein